MKKTLLIVSCLALASLSAGCTAQQMAQPVYDMAKSKQCQETQGQAFCDLNEE